ncbi:hypothetical protein GIB67_031821 [Kingdonia uniflora]|uniref:Uncharacterized protein n=1 Tax=Kingdonia uniflora TaxID=39325 RepID=A0A7J7L4P3_9MAGN|nr:hypothetical protein GIB67_031821 [Kingdonia uniflora]
MAGIRWPPEDSDLPHARPPTTADLISDDDRSVAADSWSIKSDYGSTLDDDQRHVDASDSLSTGAFQAASDYSSDKEAPDAEVEPSMLGLQSYWDSTYADELANFHEHGHTGEICVWTYLDLQDLDTLLVVVSVILEGQSKGKDDISGTTEAPWATTEGAT